MIRYLRLILAIPLFLVAMACSTNPTVANGGDPELEATSACSTAATIRQHSEGEGSPIPGESVSSCFPSIVKAGLIVGAEGGKGVMFGPGRQGPWVLQGARRFIRAASGRTNAFREAMFFMTDSAITALTSGTGLSVGMGPSVVVVDAGVARSMTTTTLKSDVYAFIFGQQGLMAGLGFKGRGLLSLISEVREISLAQSEPLFLLRDSPRCARRAHDRETCLAERGDRSRVVQTLTASKQVHHRTLRASSHATNAASLNWFGAMGADIRGRGAAAHHLSGQRAERAEAKHRHRWNASCGRSKRQGLIRSR